MYVCACVCTDVCMYHVHLCVCMYVCTLCMYSYIYVCMYVHTYVLDCAISHSCLQVFQSASSSQLCDTDILPRVDLDLQETCPGQTS